MALTVTYPSGGARSDELKNGLQVEVVDITFDSSYPTGGESFDPTALGSYLGTPSIVLISNDANSTTGYVVEYDYTAAKLVVSEQTDPAAVGGANVPLVEVTATTDLSGLTVRALVVF